MGMPVLLPVNGRPKLFTPVVD